ncbi:hypothetical protein IAT40_002716 [Kwoniella sp. CBS 6097]
MTSTERTPLLRSTAQAGPSRSKPKALHPSESLGSPRSDQSVEQSSLQNQARALIVQLRSSSTVHGSSPDASDCNLAVYLYALCLLHPRRSSSSSANSSQNSVRSRLLQDGADRRIRDVIYERAEKLLDSFEEAEVELGIDQEDERLRRVFWGRWNLTTRRPRQARWANAVDLMLPPFTNRSRPSPFLSHPVVRHILDHAWSHGVVPSELASEDADEPKSYLNRTILRLSRQVTPQRLHVLHLISFLVMYELTLSIALDPRNWITPYTTDRPVGRSGRSLAVKEVIWVIWALSDLIHSAQRHHPPALIQRLLHLPLHLAVIVALIPLLNHLAYPLLNISIPPVTFLLVLPHPPSIPILFKGLIPLSVLLQRILNRSVRTAGLLMPLVLLLFVIFGWSMNGDVFRGLWTTPESPLSASTASSTIRIRCVSVSVPLAAAELHATATDEPFEEGISPFPARVSLFLTLSLLFVFSIILTAARAIMAPKDRWDDPTSGARRWKGGVMDGDYWEKEYGLTVGRQARGAWAEAVRTYVLLDFIGSNHCAGKAVDGTNPPAGPPSLDEEQNIVTPRLRPSADSVSRVHPTPVLPAATTWSPHILPPPFNLITLPLEILVCLVSGIGMGGGLRQRHRNLVLRIQVYLAAMLCLPLALLGRILPAVARAEDLTN